MFVWCIAVQINIFFRHELFRKGRALTPKVPDIPSNKAAVPEGGRE
jgi:hypothetical protein